MIFIIIKDWFLSFAKNLRKNIVRNISKNLTCKYSQNLLDYAKQYRYALKTTSKRVIQKSAEATGDMIGNKITDRIAKVPSNIIDPNTNENDKEIPKERYRSPEERQDI